MTLEPNLFWTHPTGDPSTEPCRDLVRPHENHGVATRPCTCEPVHPHRYDVIFGQKVDCRCWAPPHPDGHQEAIPCLCPSVPAHPEGHPGPDVACIHPLEPAGHSFSGNLVFYTNDSVIQSAAVTAVNRIRSLSGVNVLNPRPLNIFHRHAIGPDPLDPKEPFRTSYHPDSHSIQVVRNNFTDAMLSQAVYHEMGHAILGHRCVRLLPAPTEHKQCEATTPARAMSEGWADFVAMAIMGVPELLGMNYEYPVGCWYKVFAPRTDIDYFVACCLWDLFDGTREDPAQISFQELFRVYSPTLQTLANGPVIGSINDYLQRLKQNHPGKADQIEKVRITNLVIPHQPHWRWCRKCQGLFFLERGRAGKCPTGGEHTNEFSYEYILVHDYSLPNGQDNWRWCRKCSGLFFAGNPSAGACPAEGAHDASGSANYCLRVNAPSSVPGQQPNWRWCKKCQGLFFAGNPSAGVCKAEGTHDSSISWDYILQYKLAA